MHTQKKRRSGYSNEKRLIIDKNFQKLNKNKFMFLSKSVGKFFFLHDLEIFVIASTSKPGVTRKLKQG